MSTTAAGKSTLGAAVFFRKISSGFLLLFDS